MSVLETVGEAWAGGVLAVLTFVVAIAVAKRRLLSSAARRRTPR